jgi:hypothetical protein
MSRHLLTTGDLLEITKSVLGETCGVIHKAGLTPKEFRAWCEHGVVVPAAGGTGRGNHRRFTFVQAVAVAYAAQWWRFGAGLDMVRRMVACIIALGERGLAKKVKSGRWYVYPLAKMPAGLPTIHEVPDGPEAGELGHTYRAVQEQIAKLSRRPAKRTGRARGLATLREAAEPTKCTGA